MNLFEAMNSKFDKLEENSKELGSEKRLGEIIQENFFNEDEDNKILNESLKEDKSEKEYKGYKLNFYSSDENPRWDNRYQTFKARPYDDQDYYWAYSYDKNNWRIVFKGKRVEERKGSFEEIIDYIEEKNKDIKPRMLYDSLKESTAENIKDGSKDYVGKPFSDFLQDIDHRSRLWVEYKDYPGEVKGFGGMAHSVSWNFANCPIVSIEVPEDDRFNDFKVVIDASKAPRSINESLKENYRSATSQDFSDIIDVIVSDITEDNIDIQEAIDENIEDWIVIESLVRPDQVIEALENNGIDIHKKVEKIVRGKLPKDKNENLNESTDRE